jgi:hypothetical protein
MSNNAKTFIRTTFYAAVVVLLICYLGTKSFVDNQQNPSYGEIAALDNNAQTTNLGNWSETIERSRSSAVRILSASDEYEPARIASSSGTYVSMFDRYFVITTMHGIIGTCENTRILVGQTIHPCGRFIELNSASDYALIEVYEINDREPIKIPRMVPATKHDWIDSLAIMNKTVYTGFPNGIGPLTIDGKIAGHTQGDFIYLLSYAWPGSSGSGVFSRDGKYIGYVIAIDVGTSIYGGNQILENIVLVVPSFKINWASALEPDNALPLREEETN